MSHEIVLVAGRADEGSRAHRRRRVEDAAAAVPGAASWSVVESSHCCLALVTAEPAGGTSAGIANDGDASAIVVAVSPSALEQVQGDPGIGSAAGAELGHIVVRLGPSGTVEIGTDGVGFIPSFLSRTPDELLYSTTLASLVTLGVDPSPDERGIVEYLVMLHPLGDRTVLRDARLLPAGGRLVRHADGEVTITVARLFAPDNDAMDDDEAVAHFGSIWPEIIGDVTARASHARLALGLSGGIDSRAIAAELARQGATTMTFTYGRRDSYEGRVAAEVADKLQLDHLFLPVTASRRFREPESTSRLLEGAHSPAEMYEAWFTDRLATFGDIVINGLAGGPLWGNEKALGVVGERNLLAALVARYESTLGKMSTFLESGIRSHATSLLRSGIEDSLDEWPSESRADASTFWNVHNRQFRWGFMVPTLLRRQGIRTEAPFLDGRFLAFCRRLTPDQRRHGNLYLKVQREVFTSTANIPRADDLNAPAHLDHVYWSGDTPYARQLLELASRHPVSATRRATRRLRTVGGEIVRRRTPFDGFDRAFQERLTPFPAGWWLQRDEAYRRQLADYLGAAPPIWPLDQSAVEMALTELRSGRPPGHDALSLAKVATVQAWFAEYGRRASSRGW